MEGFQTLGQRIVQVARLAVAAHLYETVARHTTPDGEACRVARQILRQRRHVATSTGGAGLRGSGDLCVPRLRDLVTDDERDGLFGHDDDVESE